MKKLITLIALIFSLSAFAKDKKITVTASQPQAKIYANGSEVGEGTAIILIKANSYTIVEVKLKGYLDKKITFYNDKLHPAPEKNYTLELYVDESYQNSVPGDNIANENINLNYSLNEFKAWKVVSEIVTSQFDILEVSDKSTGYIRTGWNVENTSGKTIRTRIIIKGTSTDSKASYKIKLISEYATQENANIKSDEIFKPWERILKKYKDIIPELQDRLK